MQPVVFLAAIKAIMTQFFSPFAALFVRTCAARSLMLVNAFRRIAGPRCMTLIIAAYATLPLCFAQEATVMEGDSQKMHYLIQLTGNINGSSFTNTMAVLTLSFPPSGSNNPYWLITTGFPERNSANSFFFDSEEADMRTEANTIVATLPQRGRGAPSSHFFYLSPILLGDKNLPLNDREEAVIEAMKVALPTLVPASFGKLRITIEGNRVRGSVDLGGFDPVGEEPVRYFAHFSGQSTAVGKSAP